MKSTVQLRLGILIGCLLLGVPGSFAQFSQAPDVSQSVLNSPALKPPPGAKVAIVEFGDLECPLCAAWNPVLAQAATKYHVAWARHDYLIPGHVWSPQAAVNARWFDSKSPKLGSEYRDAVFAQQRELATTDDLSSCTERFAQAHGVALPFVMDPQGKLLDAVHADCRLGLSLGVHQTPTVWVVTSGDHKTGYPLARVNDINLLYAYLDQAAATH